MSSKSTNRTNATNYSKSSSKRDARVAAQTPIDAKLDAGFEESEKGLFDYSTSVDFASTSTSNVPSSTVSAYLQKMQRGGLTQPFGCMIAIDEKSFGVLGFSENAHEMLDLSPHAVPNIEQRDVLTFGTDVRTLFRSSCAAALQKAANFGEVSLLNPILVHCRYSGKPFYAILHRIDVGLVIDFEPVDPDDVPVTAAGALKSYKLAAKAISKLQALPGGNIQILCEVLVQEMIDLTGYDRVMVYKFHEDQHGEVVAECRKPELDPYLGLHYPSTDIPQASRFLFMMNKVRIICDCLAPPVKVVQSNRLDQPLCLSGSILRAPHGCHSQYMANMGSIASLVLAVTINEEDEEAEVSQKSGRRLWGLVVCHHASPKFIPFPLRYACEFLVQVFSVQISKEVELASQLREKNILRTQTVLCDMLLRGAPVGIITQSPNVMDLVMCDGAALYYGDKFWLLGITPTEAQIRNITEWLLQYHGGSTGLSTDSLVEAGYPGATILGDAICGMAAVRISSKNFLFWFRSHAAKEIKWGGAKHDPIDKDDARKMHPRSSFKAFLEVVKRRSLPWEDVEMDAIHSLQLILRNSLRDEVDGSSRMIVNVPSCETSLQKMNELRVVTNEMVRLIETASVPILAVDVSGNVNGWNTKIAELTGLSSQEAIGTPFVVLVVEESIGIVQNMLSSASQGIEEKNVEVKLKSFGQENNGPIILVANVCCNRDVNENIVGICLIGNDITGQKMIMDKFTRIQGDYVGIVQSPTTLIPPIFMMNEQGQCFEWNDAMQKLSGLKREEVMDRMLLGEVFTVNGFGCRLKDQDTLTKLKILLNRVITGEDANKVLFGFFDKKDNYIEALLSASKRIDEQGKVTGVLCFLHVPSPELQYTMKVQKISEQAAADSLAKLSYIRHEIGKPLSGIKCMQDLMQSSDLSKEQWKLLRTSTLCREQLAKIIDDNGIATIEECYMELNSIEFNLGEALEVIKSQVVTVGKERRVQIIYDIPIEAFPMNLYGDNLRLQQVLSDFLTNALLFTPGIEGSSVLFKLIPVRQRIGTKMHIVHLEFRITHPAPGVPEELIREMFRHSQSVSREGLGLYISQKLVKIMNGTVQYLREAERSSFIILIEFPVAQQVKHRKTKPRTEDERQSSWPNSR